MLYDISKDLQIVISEDIKPTEISGGYPVTEKYVKEITNYINEEVQGIKNHFT